MNINIINTVIIILIVIIATILIKKFVENFCVDPQKDGAKEWESYHDTSYPLNSVYKDSFKDFLDKVENDKINNGSALGSVQNPMSDRDHNNRILYQDGEDVYKF